MVGEVGRRALRDIWEGIAVLLAVLVLGACSPYPLLPPETPDESNSPDSASTMAAQSLSALLPDLPVIPPPRVLRFDLPKPLVAEKYWLVMARDWVSEDPRDWEDLGLSRKIVRVPAGKHVRLVMGSGYGDLSVLSRLDADAIDSLRFFHSEGWATMVDDRCLAQISLLEGLSDLDLTGARVTPNGFLHLRHLDRLRSLAIGRSRDLDASVFEDISRLPSLETLRIKKVDLDERVALLARCSRLRELDLSMLTISTKAWEAITSLPHLRVLRLNLTNATADGQRLQLRYGTRPDRASPVPLDFSALASMDSLRGLGLPWCRLQPREMRVLAGMGRLEELDIRGEALANDILTSIGALTNLKRLGISVNRGSDLSFMERLEGLERMEISGELPTSGALAVFGRLPMLRDLTLEGIGYDVERLFETVGGMTQLRSLVLIGDVESFRGFRVAHARRLAGLKNLERLVIEGFDCSDGDESSAVALLGALPGLDYLDIRDKKQEGRLRESILRVHPEIAFTDMRPARKYLPFGP